MCLPAPVYTKLVKALPSLGSYITVAQIVTMIRKIYITI